MAEQTHTRSDDRVLEAYGRGLLPPRQRSRVGWVALARWLVVPAQPGTGHRSAGPAGAADARTCCRGIRAGHGVGAAAARTEGGRRPAGRSRRGPGAGSAGRPTGSAQPADFR